MMNWPVALLVGSRRPSHFLFCRSFLFCGYAMPREEGNHLDPVHASWARTCDGTKQVHSRPWSQLSSAWKSSDIFEASSSPWHPQSRAVSRSDLPLMRILRRTSSTANISCQAKKETTWILYSASLRPLQAAEHVIHSRP